MQAWSQQQALAMFSPTDALPTSRVGAECQGLTSHALLSLHGCAWGLKYPCLSVFIPFAGMAGGCSTFSFFFFTFLGCRGDMLVTLVTVSPELQRRDTCEGQVRATQGKMLCPSEFMQADTSPSTCESRCPTTWILTWGYAKKPVTGG